MQSSKIYSIQFLRAVAALLVVFWHAQLMVPNFPSVIPYFFGNAGVYLFFAISGFLMVFVTQSREQNAMDFLKSRAIRVVPIYWIYTMGTVVLLILVPALFRNNELSLRHFALSLLFIPHETNADPGNFLPMVRVGWTLIYEVFFYNLFAAAMHISFKFRALLSALALFLTAGSCMALSASKDNYFLLSVYGDPIILQFALGMAIAYFFKKISSIKLSLSSFIFVLAASCWMMLIGDQIAGQDNVLRLVFYGVPSALILLCGLLTRSDKFFHNRFFRVLGDSSYSIYLAHMLPLALMRWLWNAFNFPDKGIGWACIFIFLAAVFSAACGVLSYLFVERHLTNAFKKSLIKNPIAVT